MAFKRLCVCVCVYISSDTSDTVVAVVDGARALADVAAVGGDNAITDISINATAATRAPQIIRRLLLN